LREKMCVFIPMGAIVLSPRRRQGTKRWGCKTAAFKWKKKSCALVVPRGRTPPFQHEKEKKKGAPHPGPRGETRNKNEEKLAESKTTENTSGRGGSRAQCLTIETNSKREVPIPRALQGKKEVMPVFRAWGNSRGVPIQIDYGDRKKAAHVTE